MKRKRIPALLLALALLAGLTPAVAGEEPAVSALPLRTREEGPAFDGYLVKLKEDTVMPYSLGGVEYVDEGLYLVEDEALAAQLAEAAEYVEPDYYVYPLATINDPYYKLYQWYLNGTHGMGIEYAWDKGYTGSGITVAVLDTGFFNHTDFKNTKVLAGHNATNDGGTVADVDCHGTAVAGIIAAGKDNYGIVGTSYGVSLLPVRVFSNPAMGKISDIVRGINHAISQKVDVINMSLGGPGDSLSMKTAIQNAIGEGIIVVAAAGNDGTAVLNYPAAYDGVIGVGALNQDGTVADYSQKNSSVWVTAPGSDITSTHSTAETFVTGSGTSFAAPCVSSIAAIAKQYAVAKGQTLTPKEFANLLRLTALDDSDTPGYDYSYGYGAVTAKAVLDGIDKRTITYQWDGGSASGTVTDTYVPYSDTTVTLPIPTKADKFFGGWYDNAGFTGSAVTEFTPSDALADRTFHAKWIDDVTALAAVTLDGYAAETKDNGQTWVAYLPANTPIPTSPVIDVEYDYQGSEYILSHTVSKTGEKTWTITVTQVGVGSKDYTLTADNTTYHAPARTGAATVEDTSAPASLDGTTTAVRPYIANVSGWFKDEDTTPAENTLTYSLSNFQVDGAAADSIVGLSLTGASLTYTPPAAAAGKKISFQVVPSDGRFTGLAVTVTVTVGALPVSTPVLSADKGEYDALDPAALTVGFTAFDNTFSSLLAGSTALVKDTDYTLYLGPEVVDNDGGQTLARPLDTDNSTLPLLASVTFTETYLAKLANRDTSVIFRFDTGRSDPVTVDTGYTITVKNSCVGGHNYDVVTVDATCTADGSRTSTCSVCHDVKTETISQLGHSYGEWTTTKEPTCTEAGEKTSECSACHDVKTEAIPQLGHTYGEWATTKEPTCTAAGEKTSECSACHDKKTETIPQLGHAYVSGTCSRCGAKKPSSSSGSSGGSSGGGGGGSGTIAPAPTPTPKPTETPKPVTETVKGEDGSVTTTKTDPATGTVTETTQFADGSTLAVETKTDGTVTTTKTDDAATVVLVEAPDEPPAVTVTLAEEADSATVSLPVAAPDRSLVARDAETGKVIPLCIPSDEALLVHLGRSAQLVLAPPEEVDYPDVADTDWYGEAIGFVSDRELFRGMEDGGFRPNQGMSRAMVFTVFSRLTGDEPRGKGGVWYDGVLDWAVDKGLTDGSRPEDLATREELVTLLWRWAGSPDSQAEQDFADGDKISHWAADAVTWAVEEGIISGRPDGTFDPDTRATRAETAILFQRFVDYLVKR